MDVTPKPRPIIHAIVAIETKGDVSHARIAIMSNERMKQEIQANDGGKFAVPADCWVPCNLWSVGRKAAIDEGVIGRSAR